jgi:hypothetical protein
MTVELGALGVTDVVVDVDYASPEGPDEAIAILRRAR